MTILHKALSRLKETAEPTQCEEWFQKQLFGDKGGYIWFEPGTEPNTETETKLLRVLYQHFGGEPFNINSADAKVLQRLYKCRHLFDDWLVPKQGIMYRGIRDKKSLAELNDLFLKKTSVISLEGLPTKFIKIEKASYKPLKVLESWTINPLIAGYFSLESSLSINSFNRKLDTFLEDLRYNLRRSEFNLNAIAEVPVIMRTKTNKSFFGSDTFGNKFSSEIVNTKEYEVLRFSDRPIVCERLVPKPYVDQLLEVVRKIKEGLD